MSNFTEEQARAYTHKLLAAMTEAGGSDLFIANDFPPSMKAHGNIRPLTSQKLTGAVTRQLAHSVMNERQREEFAREFECNFALAIPGLSRFRVNIFIQQQHVGMVVRTIASEMPNFEKLGLPEVLKDVVMNKRGLVLVVGATGSAKSTSLAAMIDHRNRTSAGHIITIEDPVEYVHESMKSLVTHREVGVDTHSWHHALKNTLRQAPDVILIGEIRDAETMEHAIAFAETGHLCHGPLHANNANQTPIASSILSGRAAQPAAMTCRRICAIVSQRLVRTQDGDGRRRRSRSCSTRRRSPSGSSGRVPRPKAIMGKSRELDAHVDWALFELYNDGHIAYEEAIATPTRRTSCGSTSSCAARAAAASKQRSLSIHEDPPGRARPSYEAAKEAPARAGAAARAEARARAETRYGRPAARGVALAQARAGGEVDRLTSRPDDR
jgi:twitching motility protein PilU